MMRVLIFDPNGRIDCLYTEVIDLRLLGKLEIRRATDIGFNVTEQKWEVKRAGTGEPLFSHESRETCLRWEQENLRPGS